MMFKYFTVDEFDCSHTGENRMCMEFLEKLDALREECGFPFVITSGYRSPTHPEESKKTRPGTHSQGIAADIKITNGGSLYTIVNLALKHGFTGIGVSKTFVHLDTRGTTPVIWTY
jgi:uncharacterized protein YcbK (DUF882 family)